MCTFLHVTVIVLQRLVDILFNNFVTVAEQIHYRIGSSTSKMNTIFCFHLESTNEIVENTENCCVTLSDLHSMFIGFKILFLVWLVFRCRCFSSLLLILSLTPVFFFVIWIAGVVADLTGLFQAISLEMCKLYEINYERQHCNVLSAYIFAPRVSIDKES